MNSIKIAAGIMTAVLLGACQSMSSDGPKAAAELQPTKSSTVRGSVSFVQVGEKVHVNARVSGLAPNGEFGFHIHEAGDCSSGDGMSTKGHFNPYGKPHAHSGTPERHAGDLPSLRSDAAGSAKVDTDVDIITVTAGPASIVGRGLIGHVPPGHHKPHPPGR